MNIRANTYSLAANCKTAVAAFDGAPPYTYSVVSGPGTVSPGGLLTAGNVEGEIIVKAVDSLGEEATVSVWVRNVYGLVAEIIRRELGLAADQVWIYNSRVKPKTDNRLYVVVGIERSEFIGGAPRIEGNMVEKGGLAMYDLLSIDVQSSSFSQAMRKNEVILALGSLYSQRQQETNSFYLAPTPSSIVNLSEVDGTLIPYHFNLSVAIQYGVRKNGVADYYETAPNPGIIVDP